MISLMLRMIRMIILMRRMIRMIILMGQDDGSHHCHPFMGALGEVSHHCHPFMAAPSRLKLSSA